MPPSLISRWALLLGCLFAACRDPVDDDQTPQPVRHDASAPYDASAHSVGAPFPADATVEPDEQIDAAVAPLPLPIDYDPLGPLDPDPLGPFQP